MIIPGAGNYQKLGNGGMVLSPAPDLRRLRAGPPHRSEVAEKLEEGCDSGKRMSSFWKVTTEA